jgi:spermidine synthase
MRGFRFAIGVLIASAAAALGHESLWTRRMADLLGANLESSMRVLGCFFLGLSLGAAAAAVFLPRVTRAWRAVGLIEFGIGLFSLPVMLLPELSSAIWPLLGSELLVRWQGSLLKWILSVLLIVPPSFLIGMTLPLVTLAAASAAPVRPERLRPELLLYAIYTAGGVLGLALPRRNPHGSRRRLAILAWKQKTSRGPEIVSP